MVQSKFQYSSIANALANMHWTIKYLIPLAIGAIVGIFFLMPINEYVIYSLYEKVYHGSFLKYLGVLYGQVFHGQKLVRVVYYSSLGGSIGLISTQFFISFQKRQALLLMFHEELNRNIHFFINQGETEYIEYKSSFRYDHRQEKVNRALELVIMKTLAGFMNSEGGTLLIGVGDDGNIVGLKKDFDTLKRSDADGYEQALISTVANHLGTGACKMIKLNFHKVEGKDVCRITVAQSSKPIYVKSEKSSKFYIRTGSSTREMELDEAVEYIHGKF